MNENYNQIEGNRLHHLDLVSCEKDTVRLHDTAQAPAYLPFEPPISAYCPAPTTVGESIGHILPQHRHLSREELRLRRSAGRGCGQAEEEASRIRTQRGQNAR